MNESGRIRNRLLREQPPRRPEAVLPVKPLRQLAGAQAAIQSLVQRFTGAASVADTAGGQLYRGLAVVHKGQALADASNKQWIGLAVAKDAAPGQTVGLIRRIKKLQQCGRDVAAPRQHRQPLGQLVARIVSHGMGAKSARSCGVGKISLGVRPTNAA